ncbi:MAG TPA: hypothetical protein VHE14_00140, partial [Solirubrobacteraceae bacterium]|nr:hypothetical protein [Solirubrobacteraceae bacterium]
MELTRTQASIATIQPRGPGTDAERRAATWLVRELRARGREAHTETHWVRPQWALTALLHAVIGIAASILSVSLPVVGLVIAAIAWLSYVLDLRGRVPLIRLLTARRATQNVISGPPHGDRQVRLVIACAYDAPPAPGATAVAAGRVQARLRRALRGHWPSGPSLLVAALTMIVAACAARTAGFHPGWLKLAQLVPTVGLLVALVLLIDIALSEPSREVDAAGAAALALELVTQLDATPPRRLAVEVVFAGAGSAAAQGMRAYVRERRRTVQAERVAVLELNACSHGAPRYWVRDGPLVPVRLHPRLIELASVLADAERQLGACPYSGRSGSAAYAARCARWPAIAVGCVDEQRVTAGRSADSRAPELALEFALGLIAALDAE